MESETGLGRNTHASVPLAAPLQGLRSKGAIARRTVAALAAWGIAGTASADINLGLIEVSKIYNAAVYYRYHMANHVFPTPRGSARPLVLISASSGGQEP